LPHTGQSFFDHTWIRYNTCMATAKLKWSLTIRRSTLGGEANAWSEACMLLRDLGRRWIYLLFLCVLGRGPSSGSSARLSSLSCIMMKETSYCNIRASLKSVYRSRRGKEHPQGGAFEALTTLRQTWASRARLHRRAVPKDRDREEEHYTYDGTIM
jgi:hypothetical protein